MSMTDRQRNFRKQYVEQISPWYSGLLHVGVMYVAGISAIAWCVSRMHGATWEWLLIVPVAIAGNFVEWAMHKYVMHRLVDVFAPSAMVHVDPPGMRTIVAATPASTTSTSPMATRRSTRPGSSASSSFRGAC